MMQWSPRDGASPTYSTSCFDHYCSEHEAILLAVRSNSAPSAEHYWSAAALRGGGGAKQGGWRPLRRRE
jgi:hypothetical protein